MKFIKANPWLERGIAVCLVFSALALTIGFFDRLPIESTSLAIDWRGLWESFQHWPPAYGSLLIAPWDALLMSPIGLFSFRASWGVLSFINLFVLVCSVPKTQNRWQRLLATLLLCASFPSLRHLVDGNFEALTILGVLLTLQGYKQQHLWICAAGLLLATAKEQETWILVLAIGIYLLKYWPVKQWLRLGLILGVVVVPCLIWLGHDWVSSAIGQNANGSIMDNSLIATLHRLGLSDWIIAMAWLTILVPTVFLVFKTGSTISREKATLLMAASLLLSPYAAGNSFLSILAIGIIPIFLTYPLLGLILIVLTNLPFLFNPEIMFNYSAYYWTAMLLLTYLVCAIIVWRTQRLASDNRADPVTAQSLASNVQ